MSVVYMYYIFRERKGEEREPYILYMCVYVYACFCGEDAC